MLKHVAYHTGRLTRQGSQRALPLVKSIGEYFGTLGLEFARGVQSVNTPIAVPSQDETIDQELKEAIHNREPEQLELPLEHPEQVKS